MRSRGQRRKGRSRLSRAWAEERPGRMRHGSWGRAHGWASVPPTASQTIAASSVDAAWGSGHHHETRMRGTGSVPPQHATSCHAVACGPRRRRTTCACHTRDQTHTHQGGARGEARGVEDGGREHAASRVRHQRRGKSRVGPLGSEDPALAGADSWQTRPSHVGTGRLLHTRAVPIPTHTAHRTTRTHTRATQRR